MAMNQRFGLITFELPRVVRVTLEIASLEDVPIDLGQIVQVAKNEAASR